MYNRGFITIEYDDGNQSTYQAVKLTYGENHKEVQLFNSGNFVKDWYQARKFIQDNLNGAGCSSSVDHFIMDGEEYKELGLYWDTKNEKWMLDGELDDMDIIKQSLKLINNGYVFIPSNETWSYEEYIKYCKDEINN